MAEHEDEEETREEETRGGEKEQTRKSASQCDSIVARYMHIIARQVAISGLIRDSEGKGSDDPGKQRNPGNLRESMWWL